MSLDMAILGFLASGPLSGYELKTRCFSGAISVFWKADQAQIYRTLERLSKSGFVKATRFRQTTRPDRREWNLTEAGQLHLAEALASTPPLPPLRDPFLLQLYFSASLDDEALLEVIEKRRSEYQLRLDEAHHQSDLLAESRSGSARSLLLQQTALEGAIAQLVVSLEWLDECVAAVKSGALPRNGGAQ